MHIIKDNSEEKKVTLNNTEFIKSKDILAPIQNSPIFSFINSQKWPIIGFGAGLIVLITIFITYKLFKNKGQSNGGIAVNIQNSAVSSNNSPSCPEATTAHTGTNPINCNSEQDAPPGYSTLKIDDILAKEPKDCDPFERQALARHSMVNKPSLPSPNQV